MKHYTQMYERCEMPIGYVCEYKTRDGKCASVFACDHDVICKNIGCWGNIAGKCKSKLAAKECEERQ